MTDSVRPARKKGGNKAADAAFSFDDIEPQSPRTARKNPAPRRKTERTNMTSTGSDRVTAVESAPVGRAKTRKVARATGPTRSGPSKSDIIGVGVLVLVIVGAVALQWAVTTYHPLARPHAALRGPVWAELRLSA